MRFMHGLVLVLAVTPQVFGQTTAASDFNPLSMMQAGGIHLYGISFYSAYYASGAPSGLGPSSQNLYLTGPSVMGGIAGTFGGSKQGQHSLLTWSYSPSYFTAFHSTSVRGADNGSLNQSASVGWSRQLGSKWTLSTSANGVIANLEQLYSNPTVLSNVASLPATFDDLASGVITGATANTQVGNLLTGAPLRSSPEQAYLYGTRMLDLAASVSLSWAPSARTSYSISATGSRAQNIKGAGTLGGTPATTGLVLPQMTNADVSVAWSHALSPRTHIGAQVSSNRIFSRLEQGYASNAQVSFGRTISRRWFMQAEGGAGKLNYAHQMYSGAPGSVQYLYGGSLGFKTSAHTFIGSYDRTLGDVYGLGSGTTSAATGAWNWKHSGSAWSISASGGFQDLNNFTFANVRSWRAMAGLSRSLSPYLFATLQYVYFQLPQNLRSTGMSNSENGFIVSFTMSPSRHL